MERARDTGNGIASGFTRLAAAEARLSATGLSREDAETLARLRADIAAGLVLLLSLDDGCIGRADLAAATAPLALAVPADVMARLSAAARLAALDLAALAASVAARLAADAANAQNENKAQNEKPRRRQTRPRLELVIP